MRLIKSTIYTIILLLFTFSSAQAETKRTRLNLPVSGLASVDTLFPDSPKKPKKPFLRFRTYIAGVGRIDIKLNKERIFNDFPTTLDGINLDEQSGNATLLRGTLKTKTYTQPVAASIMNEDGIMTLSVDFFANNNRGGKNNYYHLTIPLVSSEYVGRAQRVSHYTPLFCGVTAEQILVDKMGEEAFAQGSLKGTYKLIKFGFHVDNDFYTTYKANSKAKVLSVVNATEAIYESQLGMTFKILFFNIIPNLYSLNTSNADVLLNSFREYAGENGFCEEANENHMFTGKTLNDSTLGIAYIGSMCISSYYSISLSMANNNLAAPIVFAHELGHVFNAAHTNSGIMEAKVIENNPPTTFSKESVKQISDFVNKYGDCLATVTPKPTPTPTPIQPNIDIKMSGKLNKKGEVNLTFNFSNDADSCSVDIIGAAKKSQINFSKKKVSFTVNTLNKTFSVKMPFKLIKANGPTKVFLLSKAVCPNGSTGTSGVVTLNAKNIKTKNILKSNTTWLSRLMKKLKKALNN